MSLTNFFLHPIFLNDLKGTSVKEVFEEMVQFLIDQQLLPYDLKEQALNALTVREEKLSTAIGQGLAIPHATISGLPGSIVILAKSKAGISCSSPDNLPVHLYFLVLVPSHDYGTHLRTLAQIGKFLSRPGMKQQLFTVQESADITRLINTP